MDRIPSMNCITTNSHVRFAPQEPVGDDIHIRDIAHALSYLCRANGHFNSFYSVAQHCVNCCLEARARGCSREVQLACLLHDASEAYMSDVTRPVKRLLPQYVEIEKRLQGIIYEKFGAAGEDPAIEEIDDALLYHEFVHLLGETLFQTVPALSGEPDYAERAFHEVKEEFLTLFDVLTRADMKQPAY